MKTLHCTIKTEYFGQSNLLKGHSNKLILLILRQKHDFVSAGGFCISFSFAFEFLATFKTFYNLSFINYYRVAVLLNAPVLSVRMAH